jgi:hypothetical protein
MQGRHRKHWFRFCKRCGNSERSETQPEQTEDTKPLRFDSALPVAEKVMDFTKGIVRSPQKFTVEGARAGVRQERAKAKGKP